MTAIETVRARRAELLRYASARLLSAAELAIADHAFALVRAGKSEAEVEDRVRAYGEILGDWAEASLVAVDRAIKEAIR